MHRRTRELSLLLTYTLFWNPWWRCQSWARVLGPSLEFFGLSLVLEILVLFTSVPAASSYEVILMGLYSDNHAIEQS